MAEALLFVVSKIGSTLTDEATKGVINKLSEKVKNLKELPEKVKEIGKELATIGNVIKQIATPNLTNEIVKNWIEEMREIAHHVEDVIDRYSYHARQMEEENSVKKIWHKAEYVKVFCEIADEIIKIENKIKNASERKDRWLKGAHLIPNILADVDRTRPQDCYLEVSQDHLVGFKGNRRQLTEWLHSDGQCRTIITVSGMGGLGKTTLVTSVYEKEKVKFTAHSWIVVSQAYDVLELLRKMLRSIDPEQSQLADLDAYVLKEKIKEGLKDKKYLLVLDDVWNREAYNQIEDTLQNLQGSRVIITTRQDQVATLAQPARQLKLKPLEHSDAFALFCKKAFNNRTDCKCPQELEMLANNMVARCQGLPLAIVSIGGMLSSLQATEYNWNEMYKQLRSLLANNNHVRAILNLSYHDLPGELRNCFLYCSLFPEDHLLTRESLVRLWVAEGFAVQNDQSTSEEMADRYLRELIQRNMLEAVEIDELGRVSTCKMHDLVRELALYIAKEEKFGFAKDFSSMINIDREVRRMSSNGWKDNTAVKNKFPRLRTLVALGMIGSCPQFLSPFFSESIYLTVLELQDSEITVVPESLGNLFNLRYIGLRRTRVKSLPESIRKLSNLQTLDIKQTKIEKLPQGITKIKKMRHLHADRYVNENQSESRYFVGVRAPKDLSKMEDLQTLETVEATKDLSEQLMKLRKLQTVWIDNIRDVDCANILAALSEMRILSSLLLTASDKERELCLKSLKPKSDRLHRLIIRGSWAGNTLNCPIFHDHGKNLRYLAISWCKLRGDPLQLLAPHVPNLTYLRFNNISCASILILSAGSFPKLRTLLLKDMHDVNELVISDHALPQIEGIYIMTLPLLDKIPQGIQALRSLRKLWLLDLHPNFRSHWDEFGMPKKMQYVSDLRI